MTNTLTGKTKIIGESGTLVTELKSVDKVTSNAGVDRISAYRNILEKWAEWNDLVKMATRGEINISDEYNAISEKLFGHGKNFYPSFINKENQTIYINEKGQQIRISELESVVGDFVGNNFYNIGYNPVGSAATCGILTFITHEVVYRGIAPHLIKKDDKTIPNEKDKMDRRAFLKFATGLFSGVGALIGVTLSNERCDEQIIARNNAAYVQSLISQVYHL